MVAMHRSTQDGFLASKTEIWVNVAWHYASLAALIHVIGKRAINCWNVHWLLSLAGETSAGNKAAAGIPAWMYKGSDMQTYDPEAQQQWNVQNGGCSDSTCSPKLWLKWKRWALAVSKWIHEVLGELLLGELLLGEISGCRINRWVAFQFGLRVLTWILWGICYTIAPQTWWWIIVHWLLPRWPWRIKLPYI